MFTYQVQLTDVQRINGLTIKRRKGKPVTVGHLPRYGVFTPDGRCLEESRRKRDAVRWCGAQHDFCHEGEL